MTPSLPPRRTVERQDRLETLTQVLSGLPQIMPPIADVAPLDKLIHEIGDRSAAMGRHEAVLASLQALPEQMVEVQDASMVRTVLQRVEKGVISNKRVAAICEVLAHIRSEEHTSELQSLMR